MKRRLSASVRTLRTYLFVSPLLFWTSNGAAAIVTWTSLVSGSFSDPANWSPHIPGPDDTGNFAFGGQPLTIECNTDVANDRFIVGTKTVTLQSPEGTQISYELDNPTTSETGRGIVIGDHAGSPAIVTSYLNSLSAVAATLGDLANSNSTSKHRRRELFAGERLSDVLPWKRHV
jgi:hypothetical protein